MKQCYTTPLNDSLSRLRHEIPNVRTLLNLDDNPAYDAWGRIVDQKLLPRLSPDFPLTAAICGGGSSGKSTLFNALVGNAISPMGGAAGLNRRVLFAVHPEVIGKPGNNSNLMTTLYRPFDSPPILFTDSKALVTPGAPIYIATHTIPKELVLLDTPDFDTGSRGVYTNRRIAVQALETSDIFIYIFTNSNYNNKDNTDFITRMLAGIGKRKSFLVYRVYPSFSDTEVEAHAMTVARNIYGLDAEQHLLGIYRSDEDNAVAAGEKSMHVRPLDSGTPSLAQSLIRLNTQALRIELFSSILSGVLDTAEEILDQANESKEKLRLYLDALQAAQSHCAHEALRHFPMDIIIRRFSQIWSATDPGPIKFMRRTGRILDLPLRALLKSANWMKSRFPESKVVPTCPDDRDEAESDLLVAANHMQRCAVNPKVTVSLSINDPIAKRMRETLDFINKGVDGVENPRAFLKHDVDKGLVIFTAPAHPVTVGARKRLRQKDWKTILAAITNRKDVMFGISENIEKELFALVENFREEMGFWDQVKQTFSAFLNVIPATAAVTYILSTGDPVGAVGIKVKLAGLFGFHDLYALVAIPATTGMKQADENQLKALLAPLAQTWLNDKLKEVQCLFEENITGDIIREAGQILVEADTHLTAIREDINICRNI